MGETCAVVVGALGVIGRYIVEHLEAQGDWQVIGLSRRSAEGRPRVRHIAVDLLDANDVARKLAPVVDATHIFYAAFQAAPGAASGYAANIAPNRDMLVNAVSAIERHSPGLQRVILVTGTKYYGTHLGPYRTPARESDPRHAGANYYFDQIDWLGAAQRGKRWDWVELRPQTLCGFAPGTPMSLVPAIAVYAAIRKEQGRALDFPGTAWTSLSQVTDSAHFARAATWAATEPGCALQAFNITNGDFFRWRWMWPRIAEVFDMEPGEPRPVSLVAEMADKAPVWNAMVRRHGLQPHSWDQVVAWPFADYVFNSDWDVMSSTTKARQFGFADVVDSEEMFVRLLRRFRQERIVP
jgi:nucleoside-diphosphate-sugar epimerase